ncbi:MAG: DUF2326 domain-containing protein [Bacteroidia bacterium]|nr:DUF2326 domain-containing protein [Bacteroidia bacterium]
MFLKRLIIENLDGIIRDIPFHKGLNFIIDESPENQTRESSGNNVGKTTVLRLIDYCLGGKGDSIYKDTEFSSQPNTKVENFLNHKEVLISLELKESLEDEKGESVVIKRNFLKRRKKIQSLNGENINNNQEFDLALKKAIFKTEVDKPTFRQIISKNIRIEKDRMSNIVRVLGAFVGKEVYEALFLFWLGINTDNAEEKRRISEERKREITFRNRLKKEGELPLIEQKIEFHKEKILALERAKKIFNLNENYASDLEILNKIKIDINGVSSQLSRLEIRKELILESKQDLEKEFNNIDASQIKSLYEIANTLIPRIQVTFEETLKFHNDLLSEKLDFIVQELPVLERDLALHKREFENLRKKELELTRKLEKSGIAEDLERIVSELNLNYERKGALDEIKRLWEESNEKLKRFDEELGIINDEIFSQDDLIKSRVSQFNKFFTKMSSNLYGENYILTPLPNDSGYDLVVNNIEGNPSTGKKKGQIAAFDFSYIQFADSLDINCLHFVMHDQIENIHDNQLNTLVEVSNEINGQYIVPILRDKIPESIQVDDYEVLSLSQTDKLFRI